MPPKTEDPSMMSTLFGSVVADIRSFVFYISEYRSQLTSYFPMGRYDYFCAAHNLRNVQGSRALNISLTEIDFCATHENGDVPAFKIFRQNIFMDTAQDSRRIDIIFR